MPGDGNRLEETILPARKALVNPCCFRSVFSSRNPRTKALGGDAGVGNFRDRPQNFADRMSLQKAA